MDTIKGWICDERRWPAAPEVRLLLELQKVHFMFYFYFASNTMHFGNKTTINQQKNYTLPRRILSCNCPASSGI